MKTIKTGTGCSGKAVSLPPEVIQWCEKQVAQLSPQVTGFSHYIRLLIDMDERHDPLGYLRKREQKEPDSFL